MKNICFYFMLSFSFLMFSCQKDSEIEKEIETVYLSSSLGSFMFKEGTYWIYENDSSGILDSVSVISTSRGFFWEPPITPNTGSSTKVEYYKINLHDFLTATDYTDFLFRYLITRNGNETPVFGQPILLSDASVGAKVYGAEVLNYYSLYPNGDTSAFFINVQEMKIILAEQLQQEFSHDTYLYWQDTSGVVRKRIDLGGGNFESWSLIRYNIVL